MAVVKPVCRISVWIRCSDVVVHDSDELPVGAVGIVLAGGPYPAAPVGRGDVRSRRMRMKSRDRVHSSSIGGVWPIR